MTSRNPLGRSRALSNTVVILVALLWSTAAAAADAPSGGAPKTTAAEGPAKKRAKKREAKASELTSPLSKKALSDVRFSFKPGTGLVMRTANGAFSLAPRLRAQFLYTQEDDTSDTGDRRQSFQLRRARLQFLGNVFGKHNTFKVEIAISPRDVDLRGGAVGRTPLLTWFTQFSQLRDLTVRMGQYKIPYSRERVTSSGNLQLVDRSISNSEFNLDRDVGLDIRSMNFLGLGWLRYYAGLYVGDGRGVSQPDDFGMLYLVRLEFLPLGLFKDYSETDFSRSPKPRLSIGISYAFNDRAKKNRGVLGSTPADGGTSDYHNFNVDMLLNWLGLSAQASFMWRHGTRNPGDAVDENGQPIPVELARNGYGLSVQAGYLLPQLPLEIAARIGVVRPLGETSLSERTAVGGGLSYYFYGHPLKLQADYFRVWGKGGIDNGSHQVRLQAQVAM